MNANRPRKHFGKRGQVAPESFVIQGKSGAGYCFLPPWMRNSLVPQSGQTPWSAERPFFIVTSSGFAISFFALHFTQYASAMTTPFVDFPRKQGRILGLTFKCVKRQNRHLLGELA